MKINWLKTLGVIITLFPFNISAQSSIDSTFTDYLFRDFQNEQPGASFIVIKDKEIIAQGNYGLANVEEKIANMAQTNYRIASVSKQFTAAAIQLLVEQKKLK